MSLTLSRRERTRLVLALGVAAGLLAAGYYGLFRQDPSLTFDIFYYKAQATMTGPLTFVGGAGSYHYTPVTILFFYPYVWLFDYPTAVLVHRVSSALIAVGYGIVVAWFLDTRADLEWIDRVLVVAFIALNIYSVAIVAIANVGIHFVALLGIGFVLLERDDDRGGALWAVAALLKVFPTLWGLYMLRVRRWRAVAAAIATGVGATLIGLLWFGLDTHLRYVASGAGGGGVGFASGASPAAIAPTTRWSPRYGRSRRCSRRSTPCSGFP